MRDLRYEGATRILGGVAFFFVFIYVVRMFFLKSEGFEDAATKNTSKPSCPPLSPAAAAAAKAAEETEKDKECGTRGLSPAAKAAAAAADAATAAKAAQVAEIAKKAAKQVMDADNSKDIPNPKGVPNPNAVADPKSPYYVKKGENDVKSFSVKCPSGDKPIISYMGSFGGVGTLRKSDFGDDDDVDELEGASKCDLSSSTPAPVNNDGCPKNPYNFNPDEDN
jgi:hypothetical protein